MPPKKGTPKSEEHKRKIAEALRGRKRPEVTGERNGMYGKTHSPETRKKISEAGMGRTITEETRAKLSEAQKRRYETEPHPMLGRKDSPETREKKRQAHLGARNHQFGKAHTEETKQKIAATLTEFWSRPENLELRDGLSRQVKHMWDSAVGDRLREHRSSESFRETLRMHRLDDYENGTGVASPDAIRKRLQTSFPGPNKPEELLLGILEQLFPGEYQFVGRGDLVLGARVPDFMNVAGQKKLIEMFGDYWHRQQDSSERIEYFREFGFETLIVWESDLLDASHLYQLLTDFHYQE